MSLCPICRNRIIDFGAGPYDCRECNADFKQQKFKFALPDNLDLTQFAYCDYADMGNLFCDLGAGLIGIEEYNEKMQEKVQKINARGKPNAAQLAAEAEKQRAKDYAQSLLRH